MMGKLMSFTALDEETLIGSYIAMDQNDRYVCWWSCTGPVGKETTE